VEYIVIALPALLALVVVFVWLGRLARRRTLARAASLVKLGLVLRLQRVYAHALDAADAALLARAVVAYVFSEPQKEAAALSYEAGNMPLIQKETARFAADQDLCRLITQAVLAEIEVALKSVKRLDETAIQRFERLRKLNVYVACSERPAPRRFLSAALAFYDASGREPADETRTTPLSSSASISGPE